MPRLLVTGSSGLVGGAVVEFFCERGWAVTGCDNNGRQEFFGPEGDTRPNLHRIAHKHQEIFKHEAIDITDFHNMIHHVFSKHGPFDAVVHAAAQPSHDKARQIPFRDFEINAKGTLNMLELCLEFNKNAPFIFMSTNKVYGNRPNRAPLQEWETRYDFDHGETFPGLDTRFGFNEYLSIDHSLHSLFGVSKAAADLYVQEYGFTYGMPTVCLRGGCLTGPSHAGVELHGFLNYLVKCAVENKEYTIYGYRGKQVRDNLHSFDVSSLIWEIIKTPPKPGTTYNLGGGRDNSCSILEAVQLVEAILDKPMLTCYEETSRLGDHICYISDLRNILADYPGWQITKDLERIILEIIGGLQKGSTERYLPGNGGDDYFEAVADFIVPRCYGRVLDIGCGHGFLTHRMAENTVQVMATDKFSGWQKKSDNITYIEARTEDIITPAYFADRQWNCIACTEHIEHLDIETQFDLLRWITHRLSEGGSFLGSMPDPDDPKNPDLFHKRTWTAAAWEVFLGRYFNTVVLEKIEGGYVWQATHPIVKYL